MKKFILVLAVLITLLMSACSKLQEEEPIQESEDMTHYEKQIQDLKIKNGELKIENSKLKEEMRVLEKSIRQKSKE